MMQRWVTQGCDGYELRATGQIGAATRVEYLSAVSTQNRYLFGHKLEKYSTKRAAKAFDIQTLGRE